MKWDQVCLENEAQHTQNFLSECWQSVCEEDKKTKPKRPNYALINTELKAEIREKVPAELGYSDSLTLEALKRYVNLDSFPTTGVHRLTASELYEALRLLTIPKLRPCFHESVAAFGRGLIRSEIFALDFCKVSHSKSCGRNYIILEKVQTSCSA